MYHDLDDHARSRQSRNMSGKTQCECKSLLIVNHNCVQYASLNIHKIRAHILHCLSITVLVFHENIFIIELFRVNSFLIARTVHNSKYDDTTIGFPVEVGHEFFFLQVARPLVTLCIHLALRNVPLAKRIASS